MRSAPDTPRSLFASALLISLLIHALFIIFLPIAHQQKLPDKIMQVRFIESKYEAKAGGRKAEQVSSQAAETLGKTKSEVSAKSSVLHKPSLQKSQPKKEMTKHADSQAFQKADAERYGTAESGESSRGESSGSESGTALGTASGGTSEGGVGGGNSGAIVDAYTLKVTKKVIPDYPSFSRKRREEGTVTIIVTIENNIVTKTEIEQSCGYSRLDAAAQKAASQWNFDSENKIRARIPFAFKLK